MTRAQAPNLSKESDRAYRLTEPVFFIGFMGSGKTTVTRRLARLCKTTSLDMDTYIERKTQKSIPEIFAEGGEEAFRKIETETLKEIMNDEPRLISCGGGVIVKPENRDLLKEDAFVVYLEITAEEAARRIGDSTSRPLFSDIESAKKRLEDRRPLYESVATVTINSADQSAGALAHRIKDILLEKGVLCPLPN